MEGTLAALLCQRRRCEDILGGGPQNEAHRLQRKGFPDLFFYEPRQGFNGLAIELKRDKGRATPEQKKWREQLTERGYRSVICKGRACLEEIRFYFKEDNLDL